MNFSVIESLIPTLADNYKQKISKDITIDELIKIIRDNPESNNILKLHKLDKKTDKAKYDVIKGHLLPCAKIHGLFEKETGLHNWKQFSGYMYFDIDNVENVEARKKFLISKYRNQISVLGKSCGGKGLFFLSKVKNPELITKENFTAIHKNIKETIFSDILKQFDKNANGLDRNFVIPYDENLFVNHEAEIIISTDFKKLKSQSSKTSITDKKIKTQAQQVKMYESKCVKKRGYGVTFIHNPSVINGSMNLKTHTPVKHPIADMRTLPYLELRICNIADGQKHERFPVIVWYMMFLNPDFDFERIFSEMCGVNKNFTCGSPMQIRELRKIVQAAFKNYNPNKLSFKDKTVHFHPACGLDAAQKIKIAAMLNGKKKKYESIQAMKRTIQYFNRKGETPKQTKVALLSDLSVRTVSKYWEEAMNELEAPDSPENPFEHFIDEINLGEILKPKSIRERIIEEVKDSEFQLKRYSYKKLIAYGEKKMIFNEEALGEILKTIGIDLADKKRWADNIIFE